jgi:hypothetical protein
VVLPYEMIRFVKFAGVLLFAGGVVAALVARDLKDRQVAVHRVASPGLLATWIGGYLLADALAQRFWQVWLVAAYLLTFALQGVLTWSVAREGRRGAVAVTASVALLVASLVMMVWRPGAR